MQVISSLLDLQVEKFGNKDVLRSLKCLKLFRESQDRVGLLPLSMKNSMKKKERIPLNFPYLYRLVENLFQTYTVRDSNIGLNMDLEENIFFDMDIACL